MFDEAAHEIIESFLDGEPADPTRLTDALAEPEGRAYLIDLLVLRGFVAGQNITRATVAPLPKSRWRGASIWTAAAILVLGVFGGYAVGKRSGTNGAPLAAPAPAVVDNGPQGVPAPTHVIRLERGVDWTERSGGN